VYGEKEGGLRVFSIDRYWYGTVALGMKRAWALPWSLIPSMAVSAQYSRIRMHFIEEGTYCFENQLMCHILLMNKLEGLALKPLIAGRHRTQNTTYFFLLGAPCFQMLRFELYRYLTALLGFKCGTFYRYRMRSEQSHPPSDEVPVGIVQKFSEEKCSKKIKPTHLVVLGGNRN